MKSKIRCPNCLCEDIIKISSGFYCCRYCNYEFTSSEKCDFIPNYLLDKGDIYGKRTSKTNRKFRGSKNG